MLNSLVVSVCILVTRVIVVDILFLEW